MKKIFALVLACLMVLTFTACKKSGNDPDNSTENDNHSYEIQWQTLADDDVVGAWLPEAPVADEYVLFTPEGKLRVVYGTVVFESDIRYGEDVKGNKSAYTDGSYLYGQWTYAVEDDVLTVTYPKTAERDLKEFEEQIFRRVEYTPITLLAKEGFKADEALVGTWTNAAYNDSYTFTEDGFAVFTQEYDDGINVYDTEVKYSYTVNDGKINLSYFKSNDGKETLDTFDYTIEGEKLVIGESDYYLNGVGDPALAETTAPTE